MQVYGPAHLHGPQPIGAPHMTRAPQPASPSSGAPIQDELQLSSEAQWIDKVHQLPDIRQELVARLRAEIAAGTYETDEKLDITVGRLLDEIG